MTTSPTTATGPDTRSPRDRILDCAIELFATHGFEATTMRMLGSRVGLDNSSLYRHFSGKADVANTVLDTVAGDFLATAGARFDPSIPPTLEALEAAAAAAGGYFFDRPAAARLMMHWVMSLGGGGPGFTVSVPATDISRPGGRIVGVIRGWLEEGVRLGVLRPHTTVDALVILLGAILLRPATYGHLLASLEPDHSRTAARDAWEAELRAAVRGAFAPSRS